MRAAATSSRWYAALALFVNALHQDDQQFVALNRARHRQVDPPTDLERHPAIRPAYINRAPASSAKNREVLTHGRQSRDYVTTTLLQPDPLGRLETVLHIFPTLANINSLPSDTRWRGVTFTKISPTR